MNDLYDEILKAQAEQALHIAEVTGQTGLIEKAFNDLIEKGKRAELGEVRVWSGVKYQKTSDGWKEVKEGSGGEKKEEENIEQQTTVKELKSLLGKYNLISKQVNKPDEENKHIHVTSLNNDKTYIDIIISKDGSVYRNSMSGNINNPQKTDKVSWYGDKTDIDGMKIFFEDRPSTFKKK